MSITPLEVLVWVARSWPIVLTSIVLMLCWSHARRPIALFVLGALAGYGVQWILGQLLLEMPVNVPAGSDNGAAILHILIVNGWRNVVISIVCSIPLVLWLHSITRDLSPRL
jgi:hypothetical protein